MERERLARAVGALRLPAQGAAEQPRSRGWSATTAWLGRTVAVWHGDVPRLGQAADPARPARLPADDARVARGDARQRSVDHDRLFAGLRAVVVDEVHAFAGDDRGWHLLAVAGAAQPARRAATPADRPVGHRRQPSRSCWPGCRGSAGGHRPAVGRRAGRGREPPTARSSSTTSAPSTTPPR